MLLSILDRCITFCIADILILTLLSASLGVMTGLLLVAEEIFWMVQQARLGMHE